MGSKVKCLVDPTIRQVARLFHINVLGEWRVIGQPLEGIEKSRAFGIMLLTNHINIIATPMTHISHRLPIPQV